MSNDLDAVARVVEAFERSDWQEIDVRTRNLRVHLSAAGAPADAPTAPPAASRDPETPDVPVASAAPDPAADAPVAIDPSAHLITAPSPGIFWRAPEPGAPPFTEVGQAVQPSSTVCIVEVMKLMNHLKADVAGTVTAIYAQNGTAVAKDQALFAVDTGPEAS